MVDTLGWSSSWGSEPCLLLVCEMLLSTATGINQIELASEALPPLRPLPLSMPTPYYG